MRHADKGAGEAILRDYGEVGKPYRYLENKLVCDGDKATAAQPGIVHLAGMPGCSTGEPLRFNYIDHPRRGIF